MFKNYFKLGFQNIIRHKGFSFINIAGLALGLALFILVALYVQFELSFDRFHENQDRIYRIEQVWLTNQIWNPQLDARRHSRRPCLRIWPVLKA